METGGGPRATFPPGAGTADPKLLPASSWHWVKIRLEKEDQSLPGRTQESSSSRGCVLCKDLQWWDSIPPTALITEISEGAGDGTQVMISHFLAVERSATPTLHACVLSEDPQEETSCQTSAQVVPETACVPAILP